MSSRPKGNRVTCQLKIGNVTFYTRVKSGTQLLLGLKPVTGTYPNAHKSRATGWKGTKSYTLLLAAQHTVGGHAGCVSVALPVAEKVKFKDVYAWAYKQGIIAGIITPWGIKYAWKKTATTTPKGLLQKGLDTIGGIGGGLVNDVANAANSVVNGGGAVGDFVQGVENAAGAVGGFIQGAEAAAGTVGGYIAGAESAAAAAVKTAAQLGGYLL